MYVHTSTFTTSHPSLLSLGCRCCVVVVVSVRCAFRAIQSRKEHNYNDFACESVCVCVCFIIFFSFINIDRRRKAAAAATTTEYYNKKKTKKESTNSLAGRWSFSATL